MGKKELIQLFGEQKVRMKQRLKNEGNETVTNCNQLKMKDRIQELPEEENR